MKNHYTINPQNVIKSSLTPIIILFFIFVVTSIGLGKELPQNMIILHNSNMEEYFPLTTIGEALNRSEKIIVSYNEVSNELNKILEAMESLSNENDLHIFYVYLNTSPTGQDVLSLSLYNTNIDSLVYYKEILNPEKNLDSLVIQQIIEKIMDILLGVQFAIETNIQGVEVYLDDEYLGRTPLYNLFGYIGDYELILYKEGYEKQHLPITLKEDQEIYYYELKGLEDSLPFTRINGFINVYVGDFELDIDYTISVGFSCDLFINTFGINDFSYGFALEFIQMSYQYEYQPIIDSALSQQFLSPTKELHLLPIYLTAKYHFFREFQYVIGYLGAGLGIDIATVYEDSWQRVNFYSTGIVGISVNPYPPIGVEIGMEYRFFYAGKYRIDKTIGWNFAGYPILQTQSYLLYGHVVSVVLSYYF